MRAALRYAGLGIALGAGWGVLARIWMRQVSTIHNFSWTGTLFIVGLAALAGASLGLVHAARRRGGSRWWRLAALPSADAEVMKAHSASRKVSQARWAATRSCRVAASSPMRAVISR